MTVVLSGSRPGTTCQFSASPVLFSEEAFGLAPTSDHLIVEPSSSLGPCFVPNLSKIKSWNQRLKSTRKRPGWCLWWCCCFDFLQNCMHEVQQERDPICLQATPNKRRSNLDMLVGTSREAVCRCPTPLRTPRPSRPQNSDFEPCRWKGAAGSTTLSPAGSRASPIRVDVVSLALGGKNKARGAQHRLVTRVNSSFSGFHPCLPRLPWQINVVPLECIIVSHPTATT